MIGSASAGAKRPGSRSSEPPHSLRSRAQHERIIDRSSFSNKTTRSRLARSSRTSRSWRAFGFSEHMRASAGPDVSHLFASWFVERHVTMQLARIEVRDVPLERLLERSRHVGGSIQVCEAAVTRAKARP